jgi:hypothetical protein
MKMLWTLTAAALLAGLLTATANAEPQEAIVIQKAEPQLQNPEQIQLQEAVQAPGEGTDQTQTKDTQRIEVKEPEPSAVNAQPAPKKSGSSLVERYEKRRDTKQRAMEMRKTMILQELQDNKSGEQSQ